MKKIIIISVIAFVIISLCIGIGIINSDWYFNKKLQRTSLKDVKLGDSNVTYNYYPKYEKGILKARFEFKNLDDESLTYLKNTNKDTEPLFTKEYMSKDQFVVNSIKLTGNNFSTMNGIHIAQGQTKISKKEFKQIAFDRDSYMIGLVKPYKQIVKEFWGF